jgi:hypothetical protein
MLQAAVHAIHFNRILNFGEGQERRNLEGVVAKRKTGTYSTVSGWPKIKNPAYTQTERRHELFESFKANAINGAKLPPIPKKPPLRAIPVPRKTARKSRRRSAAD